MRISSSGSCFYDDGYSDGEDDEKQGLENRIKFPQHCMYGRSEEMERLKLLYDSLGTAAPEENHQQTVPYFAVISGYPGAGKSTLVNTFVRSLDEQSKHGNTQPFFFISGKYDQERDRSDHPFSAIIRAFDSFCERLIQEGSPVEIDRLRKSIQSAIGDEIQSLMAVVPGLVKLLEKDGANPQNYDIAPKKDAWNQFKYLFQSLIRAITSTDTGRPTILFLDNLHLADDSSLDLLSVFVRDKSLNRLMVICSIQCMLENSHPVKQRLEALEEERKFDRIEVSNLSLEDINQFVADALELETKQTLPLSNVVYSQTRGNMFFAIAFLEEMHRKNILYFSVISFQWEWKLEAAGELEAELSTGILEVIVRKIREVPEPIQRALVLAAYTRSILAKDTLRALMDCDDGPGIDSDNEFTKLMDRAVKEGLLAKVDNGKENLYYRFAHDQIQQAALSLVPAGPQRDKLKFSIALRLKELAHKESEESWMLFVAADYLNSLSSQNANPICLAGLNLDCGKKAFDIGAFQPAAQYFRKGLRALQQVDAPWESHYELALSIFRANSEVELCLGNFDLSTDLSLEILRNCKSLEDKKPTYLTMSVTKGEQGKHAASLQICLDALVIFNEFPKRFQAFHMMADLRKVKRFFETNTDAFFLELPAMKDSKVRSTMELLQMAAARAYLCENLVQFLLSNLRIILLSLEYGLCGRTASGLAGYAVYLSFVGNQHGAIRMGRLSRQVLDQCNDTKKAEGSAVYVLSTFIDCWTSPIGMLLTSLNKANKSAMECGNLEAAFLFRISMFRFVLHGGYPLDAVKKFGAETLEQLGLYHVDSMRAHMLEAFLPLKYLLSDKIKCDWEDLEKLNFDASSKDEQFRLIWFYLARLFLGVMFGNLEFSKRIADKLAGHSKNDTSYLNLIPRLFLSGLAYSRLARQSGKKKHLRRSRRYAEKLRKLVYSKGTTSLFLLKLMDADLLASSSGIHDGIQASYDIAIAMALETGYIHFAALGNEIAGDFFLKNGKASLGKDYLLDSQALYKEWQAFAKVEDLAITYPTIFTSEGQEFMGSTHLMGEIEKHRRRIPVDLAHLSDHVPPEMPSLSMATPP
jgi:predicted ATPase